MNPNPNPFVCGLSGEVMTDPVILKATGVSYQREALQRRLEEDPAFGEGHVPPFLNNTALRNVIARLRIDLPGLLTADYEKPVGPR
jgi:hypothetical protein